MMSLFLMLVVGESVWGELELNDVVSIGLKSDYRSDRHVGLKSEEYRWVTSE